MTKDYDMTMNIIFSEFDLNMIVKLHKKEFLEKLMPGLKEIQEKYQNNIKVVVDEK